MPSFDVSKMVRHDDRELAVDVLKAVRLMDKKEFTLGVGYGTAGMTAPRRPDREA